MVKVFHSEVEVLEASVVDIGRDVFGFPHTSLGDSRTSAEDKRDKRKIAVTREYTDAAPDPESNGLLPRKSEPRKSHFE